MNVKDKIEPEPIRERPQNSDVNRLVCNKIKLINNINWPLDYNIEKSFIETIEWLKKNIHLYKPNLYNV